MNKTKKSIMFITLMIASLFIVSAAETLITNNKVTVEYLNITDSINDVIKIPNTAAELKNMAESGGTIVLKNKTYDITSIAPINISDNTIIKGNGLIFNNGTEYSIILSNNNVIDGIRFYNNESNSLKLGNNSRIVNNYFRIAGNASYSIASIYGINTINNLISNNNFENDVGKGYNMLLSHNSNMNIISNNKFEGGYRNIYLIQASYNVIDGNLFNSSGVHRSIYLNRGSSYNTISNNIIKNPLYHAITVSSLDYATATSYGNQITGNKIYNSLSNSIVIEGSLDPIYDTYISGNQIWDGGGILVRNESNRTTISGNYLYQMTSSGIKIDSPAGNTNIVQNIINDASPDITDGGTNTFINQYNETRLVINNDIYLGSNDLTASSLISTSASTTNIHSYGNYYSSSKYDSQGNTWASLTSPNIVFDGGAADQPEISFIRGGNSRPDLSIRKTGNGGSVYSGPGTVTPTLTMVWASGETKITGVSSDGTGKAVCVKADGNLGTCSDAVGAGGTCTCA